MCPPLVVIQLPRYLNFSTSLRTSPFSLISVFTFPSPFSTMMTVFFVFISIPNFLHFALVFSSRICRSSAVFAVKTVSSTNRILVIVVQTPKLKWKLLESFKSFAAQRKNNVFELWRKYEKSSMIFEEPMEVFARHFVERA